MNVVPLDIQRLSGDLLKLFGACSLGWSGFAPPDEAEAQFLLRWVCDYPHFAWLALYEGEPAGFIVLQPDLAPTVQRWAGGRSLTHRLALKIDLARQRRGRRLGGWCLAGCCPGCAARVLASACWPTAYSLRIARDGRRWSIGPLPDGSPGSGVPGRAWGSGQAEVCAVPDGDWIGKRNFTCPKNLVSPCFSPTPKPCSRTTSACSSWPAGRQALQPGATTILKDNISWHFPMPGANTTPWQLEGTILALRAAGFDDLVCVQNQTVVTNAFKGEDLNGYVPIFRALRRPGAVQLPQGGHDLGALPAQGQDAGPGPHLPGGHPHPRLLHRQEHRPPADGQDATCTPPPPAR